MKSLEWQLHAKTSVYKARLNKAKKIIQDALQLSSWCVSWSSGKDSTALVHLVRSIAPNMPILIQFDDCDWPEKEDYVERVSQDQKWNYHRVDADFSIWDAAKEHNIGHDNLCAQSHVITRDGFIKPLEDKRNALGIQGVMLGLRISESRARKMNLCTRGHTYKIKDGSWRCNPLSIWSASDVFAYLVSNNVEINPCYFNNRFFQPEDIRLSWALPTPSGLSHGDMEHMRKYNPEQYRKLRDLEVV